MMPRPAWRVLATALALLVALVATDAEQLVPRVRRALVYCCCAETGVDASCTCTGSCCQHEDSSVSAATATDAPDGAACVSPRCARRGGDAPGATALEPGMPPAPACLCARFASVPLALSSGSRLSQRVPAPRERPPAGRTA